MTDGTATTGAGRPRDEELTEAILRATAELMREVGYDRLTIADVASRVECGRGAIYRRWSTKEELALASLRSTDRPRVPLVEDPRVNIERIAKHISREIGTSAQLIASFVVAGRDDPELAKAVRDRVAMPDRQLLRQQIAAATGGSTEVVDFLADAIPGVALMRSLILDQPTANNDIARSIGQILDRLAAHQPSTGARR